MDKVAREKIIEAASKVFSLYGYEKTTIEEIAKMADKGKTTVYYYFSSKAEIFSSALKEEVERICNALEKYRQGEGEILVFNFRDYLKLRMELVLNSPLYSRFMPEILRKDSKSELYRLFEEATEKFNELEREFFGKVCFFGKSSGALDKKVSPEIFARMLNMITKGAEVLILISDDKPSSKETYNEMVNFITKVHCNNLV